MERKNAPKELKWNLENIYPNIDEFYADFKKLEENCDKFAFFKGKLGNFDKIFEFFQFSEKFNMLFEKVYSYIFLNHDVDLNNTLYLELLERINLLISKLSMETAYVQPELAKLSDEFFESLLANEKFKEFEFKIKAVMDSKKYILSEKEEVALATTAKFTSGFSEIFETLTESDFKFEPVEINGEKHTLTKSNYGKFIESTDRNIRAQAYNNLFAVYNQFSKTIATNYINFVKMTSSEIDLRKADTVFNYKFFQYKISKNVLDTLNNNVNKNLNLEHKYFELLKKVLGLDEFRFYDVYQSLSVECEKNWSIDEQKEIVLSALAPLGNDYIKLINSAYNNNWIDYYVDQNKKSGGYMLDVYGIHPYILLNDTGKYESLSTLAHELGHAMHSYYSNKNQSYSKHDYVTFLAEIASTVNEILLIKYMIKNSKDEDEKLFYLSQYLQSFKGTVFRQTMFGEFENFAINKAEHNEILSLEILDNKYKSLLEKHFSDIVTIDENIIHEWLLIPHFYSPYYVFQYATSYISAVYIANSILNNKNNMIEKYKNMLSSGCNGYPLDILKNSGIDLLNDEIYNYSFADMRQCLDEVEKILKNKNS